MNNLKHISTQTLQSMQVVSWGHTNNLKAMTFNQFNDWVASGLHGSLNYLADERKDKRKSLTQVYPDAKSALVFLFDYRAAAKLNQEGKPTSKIASYTIGFDDQDYHFWIKEKLKTIGELLKEQDENLSFDISLDVHPVLERDLAYRAGLGWFGKNSMLINKEFGSYQLIGSLILNKELGLTLKEIETDHCGTCTRCIDACPTNAILDNTTIDASKCISTFTIETFKDESPPKGYPTKTNEVFGCDICQQVCPWNTKPLSKVESLLTSKWYDFFNRSFDKIYKEISEMSNNEFKKFFKGSSFERGGKRALLKNLKLFIES